MFILSSDHLFVYKRKIPISKGKRLTVHKTISQRKRPVEQTPGGQQYLISFSTHCCPSTTIYTEILQTDGLEDTQAVSLHLCKQNGNLFAGIRLSVARISDRVLSAGDLSGNSEEMAKLHTQSAQWIRDVRQECLFTTHGEEQFIYRLAQEFSNLLLFNTLRESGEGFLTFIFSPSTTG